MSRNYRRREYCQSGIGAGDTAVGVGDDDPVGSDIGCGDVADGEGCGGGAGDMGAIAKIGCVE